MRKCFFVLVFSIFSPGLLYGSTLESEDLNQGGDFYCDIELCGTTLYTNGAIHVDADNGYRYLLRGRGTLTMNVRYCFDVEFRRDAYGRKYAYVCRARRVYID